MNRITGSKSDYECLAMNMRGVGSLVECRVTEWFDAISPICYHRWQSSISAVWAKIMTRSSYFWLLIYYW